MNLFNIGKKKKDDKEHYYESNMEIIVDKKCGRMTIATDRRLSEEELEYYFRKYVWGEDE